MQNTIFSLNKTINCKGKLINIKNPLIMGILNYTDDSFYDGGNSSNLKKAIKYAETLIQKGADIIDIGAMSSRAGSKELDLNTEKKKIKQLLKFVRKEFPEMLISIDTYRSEVANTALDTGADIINDISAGEFDPNIINIVKNYKAPYIIMHTKGKPENMQENASYGNIVNEVIYYFSNKIDKLNKKGINDIIIDPGFGFAKNLEHNYALMQKLEYFNIINKPILVGISRKSMIYKLLNQTPSDAIIGTSILNAISILKGASIIRVHDVDEAKQVIKIINQMITT